MAETKNLCAQIPIELHNQVTEAKEQAGQTTSEYMTTLLTEYFKMKKDGGNATMPSSKTMAFQIPEELFRRIKVHLERETIRTGKKLTQREFVLGLIETALEEAERNLAETAPSGPCEAQDTQESTLPQEEVPEAVSTSV